MLKDAQIAQTMLEDSADKDEIAAANKKANKPKFVVSDPSYITEGVLNAAVLEYAENRTPYLPRKTEINDDYLAQLLG